MFKLPSNFDCYREFHGEHPTVNRLQAIIRPVMDKHGSSFRDAVFIDGGCVLVTVRNIQTGRNTHGYTIGMDEIERMSDEQLLELAETEMAIYAVME